MASWIAGIMLIVMVAPAPEEAVCDWMSGASQPAYHPYFANVAAAQVRGDYERAVAGFISRSKQIAELAEKSCFEAQGATLAETEKFLDRHVRGDRPLLFARRDQFALSAETVAWGAWLACRDGQTAVARRLLKAGWRDWADPVLQNDAALLLLANGEAALAADFLDEKSKSPGGLVALALFHCRTSNQEVGRKWFEQALLAATEETLKAEVRALQDGCGK